MSAAALGPSGEYAELGEELFADALQRGLSQFALERMLEAMLVRTIGPTSPGAGVEITASPGGGSTWELLGVRYLFATSATVATRRSNLYVLDQDGSQTVGLVNNTTQAAGAGPLSYSWVTGFGTTIGAGPSTQPLPSPPLVVPPTWTAKTITSSLDAGDSYTGVVFTVREWSVPRVRNAIRYLLAELDSIGGIA